MNRWNRCVKLEGSALEDFFDNYLGSSERSLLLIAGGGFDPRSTSIARRVAAMGAPRKRALIIREERPGAPSKLREQADVHTAELSKLIADSSVADVPIFAEGNAVVGGREVAKLLGQQDFSGVTDILLDISALSTGVFFPAVRMLLGEAERNRKLNVHVVVDEQPATDYGIVGVASDRATPVHGFKGRIGLDETGSHARLWLPQLVLHRRQTLERIHTAVSPDDVCPILPFPCANPRLPDQLVEEYREMLEAWKVDVRNFVYAAENDPLDLYATIVRLVDTRERVFAAVGGSLVTLSPAGGKLLSVGSLLAALERDLPVVFVESVGYEITGTGSESAAGPPKLVHLWLEGEAYDGRRKTR
ncbi:MAG: hypothetical protein QOJ64_1684 [Acidobacteriota bacterium]|jgi:hypothetical protein|nr:hypothetical protein [Acidobacteriota bacterium]